MKPQIQIVDLSDLIQIVYAVGCNFILQHAQKGQNVDVDADAVNWTMKSARRYVHMVLESQLENTRVWKEEKYRKTNIQAPLLYLAKCMDDEPDLDNVEDYFDGTSIMIEERMLQHIGDDPWMDWSTDFIDDYVIFRPKGDRRVVWFEYLRACEEVTLETLNTFDG